MHGFLFQAFVYLCAAVVSVPIANRLGFGSVLGYLLAGAVIGPHVMGLVGGSGQDVMHYAEFGVVMMLFLIGLELEPARLWRLRNSIIGMGGAQLLGTVVLAGAGAMFLGMEVKTSLAVGLILAMSSTAIVLQSLKEKGLDKTQGGQGAFSILLFQDIAVIPILAVLPFLAIKSTTSGAGAQAVQSAHAVGVASLPPWLQALAVSGAVLAIVVGGRFFTRPVFRFIAGSGLREMFTAAALMLVIGIALLMESVGMSAALGTFLAGVVLADNEYRHELEGDIEPFKGLLLGLFFISVGAGVDFPFIWADPLIIVSMVLGVMILKLIVLFIIGRAFKMPLGENMLLSISLCQVGEFAFVLLSLAGAQHVLQPDTIRSLIAVVALSMLVTPPLLMLCEKVIMPRFQSKTPPQPMDKIDNEEAPVILAGFGRFGNTVGRILLANGIKVTILDLNPSLIDMVRRVGLKAYYGDASRLDLLHAAGVQTAKIMILALDSTQKTREITHTMRKHFPHVKIIARTRGRDETYQLMNEGHKDLFQETFGSALNMGETALRRLGFRAFQAQRAVRTFRHHDEDAMQELAKRFGDEKAYLSFVREKIEESEALLRDSALLSKEVDHGWDNDALRNSYKKSGTPERDES